jgi:hypothetical protein
MNIFKKSKPANQIINLSAEQKEDFFKCFIKYKFTMVETKHKHKLKLIDYAKMVVEPRISHTFRHVECQNCSFKYQ